MPRSDWDSQRLLERLEEKKKIVGECWRYTGSHNDEGYGHAGFLGRVLAVHRLSAYLFFDFNLDSNRLICHKNICQFKDCWNPEHLYVGDEYTNQRDRVEAGHHNKAGLTHCGVCGYSLSGDNLYEHGGKRYCKNCRKHRQREYTERRKGHSLINTTTTTTTKKDS